jgi:hypothetical protein
MGSGPRRGIGQQVEKRIHLLIMAARPYVPESRQAMPSGRLGSRVVGGLLERIRVHAGAACCVARV